MITQLYDILKTNKLYTLNGWILRHVNYISIKLFENIKILKKERKGKEKKRKKKRNQTES